jgi:hypothetical protein
MVVIDNKLAARISTLAMENNKTFDQQLELMIETFEIMPIQFFSYLPSPIGGHQVPVIEVSGQVIQRGEGNV